MRGLRAAVLLIGLMISVPLFLGAVAGVGVAPIARAIFLDANLGASCVVLDDGNVDCWGQDPTFHDRALGDTLEVAAGQGFACYLLLSRDVECQGTLLAPHPTPPRGGDVRAIDASNDIVCAVRDAGDVVCASKPGNYPVLPPHAVSMAIDVSVWDSRSTGVAHACALLADGNVDCWSTSAPMAGYAGGDAVSLATGPTFHCVARANGRVWCSAPVSGAGAVTDALSVSGDGPVCALRPAGQVACFGPDATLPPANVFGDAVAVAAGGGHACALRANGEVLCWGRSVGAQAPYLAPALAITPSERGAWVCDDRDRDGECAGADGPVWVGPARSRPQPG